MWFCLYVQENAGLLSGSGPSDLECLIKSNTDENALGLSTSLLRAGHQGASWQDKLWLKLCPGGGWTAMIPWPLRGWDSNSESKYFLFLMVLLKIYHLCLSFSFSACSADDVITLETE